MRGSILALKPRLDIRSKTGVLPTNMITNNAANSDFETWGRRHQKSKTGVSVARQKDTCPPNFFLKKDMGLYLERAPGRSEHAHGVRFGDGVPGVCSLQSLDGVRVHPVLTGTALLHLDHPLHLTQDLRARSVRYLQKET